MKRKCLLTLLPALMVLASCNNAPKVEPKTELGDIVEDTLAHDEIFGDSKFAGNLGVRKAYDGDVEVPEDTGVSYPALGIQSKKGNGVDGIADTEDDTISIRFVAAIQVGDVNGDTVVNDADLAATEVHWCRTIFKNDGTVSKAATIKQSTKAYTSLAAPNDVENDGIDDNILTIEEFNGAKSGRAYTHFVVYTLLDLPLTYGNYFITIEFDVNDEDYSEVLATTIDQTTQFVYDPVINDHPLNNHYFAVKKSASGFDVIDAAATPGSGNLAKFEGIELNAGEDLIIVHRVIHELGSNDDLFEVFGYDKIVRTNPDFEEGTNPASIANNMFAVKHNGTYTFYYNNKDEIIIDKKIYFEGPWWWEGGYESWINLKHDDGGSGEYKTFAMTATGVVDHQYYAYVDISYYTQAEFYRNNGSDTQNWTGMKTIPVDGRSLYKHAEADGGGGDTWY